ncbi:MAG: hypothetical protein KIT79_10290 [Deltaproteobacteria bacterium]|nr:hypothetical protein [Deltaproteobacteria bacterium]
MTGTCSWSVMGAAFAAGLVAATAGYWIFRHRLAEAVINRKLDRARRLYTEGDSDGAARELKEVSNLAIPQELLARVTVRQVSAIYRETGLEARVQQFIGLFEPLDEDGRPLNRKKR